MERQTGWRELQLRLFDAVEIVARARKETAAELAGAYCTSDSRDTACIAALSGGLGRSRPDIVVPCPATVAHIAAALAYTHNQQSLDFALLCLPEDPM